MASLVRSTIFILTCGQLVAALLVKDIEPGCPNYNDNLPAKTCVDNCTNSQDGDYASCMGPRYYVTCTNGRAIDGRNCPAFLHWNDATKKCHYPKMKQSGYLNIDLSGTELFNKTKIQNQGFKFVEFTNYNKEVIPIVTNDKCNTGIAVKILAPSCLKKISFQIEPKIPNTGHMIFVSQNKQETTYLDMKNKLFKLQGNFNKFTSHFEDQLTCGTISENNAQIKSTNYGKNFNGDNLFTNIQTSQHIFTLNFRATKEDTGICKAFVKWQC